MLEHLRSVADGNGHTQGRLFERLVRSFLKADRLYADKFEDVWLWDDWPNRRESDPGVDLVAKEKDGSLCAIQCKFYGNKTLTKSDIDSFLEAGSRSEFQSMMLVYTGRGYGKKVQEALAGHKCNVVNFESLASSHIDWPDLAAGLTEVRRKEPHDLWEHQRDALDDVVMGLEKHDRGQLLMACGTGKTLTSLRIAERIVGKGGLVLYAVPSISLMHQAIRYWSEQRTIPHAYVGVCSDPKVSHGESVDIPIVEMEIGVSTDENRIASTLEKHRDRMTVVFTTYQSMGAVVKAQKISDVPFDLVLCDEAHRTTGAESGSSFTLVHGDKNIRADKRIYMTATPRIYKAAAKTKADQADRELYSMDDDTPAFPYGPVLHRLSFSDAIDRRLLTDYKVIVLGVAEEYGGRALQKLIAATTNEGDINLTDAARMLGLYRVLENPEPENNVRPLQTAIVYTNRVRDSERFSRSFESLVLEDGIRGRFGCDARHVDGKQNATERAGALQWLRDSKADAGECRVVSNARCLSEGVDVPSLDVISFLNPKSSQVEIIQAVGRVMRKSKGKNHGYVVIPIGIPPGAKSETILNEKKTFEIIWNVLRALRSHDSQMGVEANTLDLKKRMISKVKWIGIDRKGRRRDSPDDAETFPLGELDVPAEALYSRIVDEVGDRQYFERWARDVADVVPRIQERIGVVVSGGPAREKFDAYMAGLRDIIHDELTYTEGIEMLAQHMVTRRIFNAMFGTDDFATSNPMSVALDGVLGELRSHGLDTELRDLEKFYRSIERRVEGLDSHDARQPVISELYGTFFKKAFPKMAKRLGVVYTPTDVVDFILRSVDHVLRENFGRGLTDEGVNVIDPFTGAGTFIARMMSNDMGLIRDGDIERKYRMETFANEIVLLAYYIAAVNCESVYAQRTGRFQQFEGLSFTDTFNPCNLDEYSGDIMAGSKRRIRRQRAADITCIVGNPPYSAGQRSANEDNQNTRHHMVEQRIKDTYTSKARVVGYTGAILNPNNSYMKALRWASDRIGESGVIGFITPSAWIIGSAEVGIRACLQKEFTDVYCFDLRGNAKLRGDAWRREGDKIFGEGSREATTIVILVKNPAKTGCTIHYHDIGNYLSREQKLGKVRDMVDVSGVPWSPIDPNKYHDWVEQRGKEADDWENLAAMGSKDGKRGRTDHVMFHQYTNGLSTHRDGWVYNTSRAKLIENMKRTIDYCNNQDPNNFKIDVKRAKWSKELSRDMKKRGLPLKFDEGRIRTALYRPFFKQLVHLDVFVSTPNDIPKFFPRGDMKNPAIMVPDKIKGEFSAMITDTTPDRHIHEASQAFPLKVGKKQSRENVRPAESIQHPASSRESGDHSTGQNQGGIILGVHNGCDTRSRDSPPRAGIPDVGDEMTDNITDWTLERYRTVYNDYTITKEDIFYYTYGVLHSPDFRKKYQAFLKRGIPNIPMAPDFRAFEQAGRALADLHLNYETGPRYDLGQPLTTIPNAPKKVEFGRKLRDDSSTKTTTDSTKLVIDRITVYDNLPHIQYNVSGLTPLGWLAAPNGTKRVSRYSYTKDDITGIENYPLEGKSGEEVREIVERLAYVGVESDRIIAGLPKEFEMDTDSVLVPDAQTTLTGESQNAVWKLKWDMLPLQAKSIQSKHIFQPTRQNRPPVAPEASPI